MHSDIGNMVCKRTIAYKLKKNREDQQATLISNELYHSAKILYRCYIHLNDYSAKKKVWWENQDRVMLKQMYMYTTNE